ncbi:MAG: hypothetical protein RIT43_2131 [Bacteroidota bacterium]|jgi:hypothetical protein
MASKRTLKRNVNHLVYDVVEECFVAMEFNPAQTENAEKIIDEAADFQDAILQKINSAKNKNDFRPIRQEVEKAAINFIERLNSLS